VNWVFDADIRGFFDNMSHEWTMKFIQHRVADRRMLRLIQKWLKGNEGGYSPGSSGFTTARETCTCIMCSTCGLRSGARKSHAAM
jgi:hypothetical protein